MTRNFVDREELARTLVKVVERLVDIFESASTYDYEKGMRVAVGELKRLAENIAEDAL